MGTIATGDTPAAGGDGFAPPTTATTKITDALYDAPAPDPGGFYRIERAMDLTFNDNLTKLADRTGLSLDAQATERSQYADLMRASGLDQNLAVAELLHTAWSDARMADARPGVEQADVLAEIAAMNEATRAALREEYGARDAEELLQRTNKFVKQHPKLAAIMKTRGVGSRLDVVTALFDHVRAVNFR